MHATANAPSAPANLTATRSGSNIVVSWGAVSNATGYDFEYRKGGTPWSGHVPHTSTSPIISLADPNQDYQWRVRINAPAVSVWTYAWVFSTADLGARCGSGPCHFYDTGSAITGDEVGKKTGIWYTGELAAADQNWYPTGADTGTCHAGLLLGGDHQVDYRYGNTVWTNVYKGPLKQNIVHGFNHTGLDIWALGTDPAATGLTYLAPAVTAATADCTGCVAAGRPDDNPRPATAPETGELRYN